MNTISGVIRSRSNEFWAALASMTGSALPVIFQPNGVMLNPTLHSKIATPSFWGAELVLLFDKDEKLYSLASLGFCAGDVALGVQAWQSGDRGLAWSLFAMAATWGMGCFRTG